MKPFLSILLWSVLCCFNRAQAQTVDFSYSTSSGLFCNPQQVDFVQQCTGSPTNFIWRFGNGQQSTSSSPSIVFTAAGTYSVSLTAVYANNAVTTTKVITINPTPAITITADRNYICQPGPITFTANGSGTITSYQWDFGDGNVQTTPGNSITHVYANYNPYTVSVKGVTNAGCFATATMSVNVTKFPITNVTVTPDKGCVPVNSLLTATPTLPTGDAPANFAWDFGDGSPIGNTPTGSTSHTYTNPGQINTANVVITSVQGCVNQYSFPPFGFGTPPFNTVAVTADGRSTYCGSETITFNGSAVNANSYQWDFGDGVIQTTASTSISHKYSMLGPQTVTLTPIYNGCNGTTATININIVGVIANYSFSNSCGTKNTFNYANSSLGNISSFRWTFSDIPNTPDAVNFNTRHSFPTVGSFTTKLYIYDAITGCSDSLITDQYTAIPVFTSNKNKVCKDSTIQYTVGATYPPVSNYTYEFHVDGQVVPNGTSPVLTYTPLVHGMFNEYVVISGPNSNTCDDTLYLSSATAVQGPVIDFSMPTLSCFLNNSFPITNNTVPFFPSDQITTWFWDFGDGTTSPQQFPPPHHFTGAGNYRIILTATDLNGCAQKDSVDIAINLSPAISIFPKVDTLCSGQSLNLYAFTADTLTWITTTNLSCQNLYCDTVLVNPGVTTDYIAEAKNQYGCISRDTSTIKVYSPFTLQALPADTTICPGALVRYNTSVKGVTSWTPSTYLTATDIPNPISIPLQPITYTVIVSDSAGCYADTTDAIIRFYPLPTVNAGPDLLVSYNSAFTLNPVYSPGIRSYNWSPSINNLSCVNCPSPTGVATVSTAYTIEVTSQDGCRAKDTVAVVIACDKGNLYLPSGFTPNNDGRNDMFYPIGRGYRIINRLVVFDRWGNKVFERANFQPNAASLGWDGRLLNKQLSDANMFVWIMQATCDAGSIVETKGTVMLIR